jgi:hypothetical protein
MMMMRAARAARNNNNNGSDDPPNGMPDHLSTESDQLIDKDYLSIKKQL